MARKQTLEARLEKLKEQAADKGLLNNLLYEELLNDFYYQTNLMQRLKQNIDDEGVVIEKCYRKNAPNLYPNSLIATYNATSNARVNTVSAIAKVIKNFDESQANKTDPLLELMNGGDDE
jgi:hypothetical protein